MTMYCVEVDSASNIERYRSLWCSRTNTVRCAPRFLVSSNLLGPESQVFWTFIGRRSSKHSTLMTKLRVVVDSA